MIGQEKDPYIRMVVGYSEPMARSTTVAKYLGWLIGVIAGNCPTILPQGYICTYGGQKGGKRRWSGSDNNILSRPMKRK